MIFIKTALISVAIGILLTETFSVAERIKKLLKRNPYSRFRPFDCAFCMTFWSSLIISVVFTESIMDLFTSIALSLILIKVIQR